MKTIRILAMTAAPLALAMAPSLASAMTPEGVVSSSTTSTTTSTAVATAPDGPPVLHVTDVTSNGSPRHVQLYEAYTDCLVEQGAPTIDPSSDPRPVPMEDISKSYGVTVAWPVPAGPRQACADLDPIYPPVLEAASNPNFAQQAQTYVGCLQSHGEWVRLLNDHDLDWTYRAGHDVPDNNAAIEDDCLIGTFGSD